MKKFEDDDKNVFTTVKTKTKVKVKKKEIAFFDDDEIENSIEFLALFCFFTLWTFFIDVIMIGKIIDNAHEYIIHFTNWTWTANALFWTADFFCSLYSLSQPKKYKNFYTLFILSVPFWITNGMSWLVFWLVFIMFADNSNILLNLTTINGGEYTLGFVLDMDRVFHVLPPIFCLLYCFFRRKAFAWAIKIILYRGAFSNFFSWLYILTIVFGPLIALIFYCVSYNIEYIYGISTPLVMLIFLSIAVALIFNGIPLLSIRRNYVPK